MRAQQAIITICNPKMLQAHGFLMRIFSLFKKYDISVDAVTTSEISVAMTVDMNSLQNQDFKDELKELGNVKIENNYALVSLIGNRINHTSGVSGKIFKQLDEINIRMICQGASVHNFCILVEEDQGKETVNKLHRAFIK
jgi:aspartate kinase